MKEPTSNQLVMLPNGADCIKIDCSVYGTCIDLNDYYRRKKKRGKGTK